MLGCYIDYNTLQIFNPKQTTVQDTFFYNGHSVLHGSAMRGLIYRDNTCAFPIGQPRGAVSVCDVTVQNIDIESQSQTRPLTRPLTLARPLTRPFGLRNP